MSDGLRAILDGRKYCPSDAALVTSETNRRISQEAIDAALAKMQPSLTDRDS